MNYKRIKLILALLIFLSGGVAPGQGNREGMQNGLAVRVKDIIRIDGDENYTIIGYGLVVGLAGTGDQDPELTQRTLANMLHHFNVVVDEKQIVTPNVAAVIVTATIRRLAHKGDQVQGTVSALGDAKSLTGGELLPVALLGGDGEIWATAQGPLATGGFLFGDGGPGGNVQVKNHPTTGMLTNGVKLHRDLGLTARDVDTVRLFLNKPDYTSAVNLAAAVNEKFFGTATAVDAATVRLRVPHPYNDKDMIAEFIREVEQLHFVPDRRAKIVFNERTGTIVIGSNVRISSVAISHGNISVNIKNFDDVSQPSPFSEAGTTSRVQDQATTVVEEGAGKMQVLPDIATVGELVSILNNLGVTSRDIIIIFHALREAGALYAELEFM